MCWNCFFFSINGLITSPSEVHVFIICLWMKRFFCFFCILHEISWARRLVLKAGPCPSPWVWLAHAPIRRTKICLAPPALRNRPWIRESRPSRSLPLLPAANRSAPRLKGTARLNCCVELEVLCWPMPAGHASASGRVKWDLFCLNGLSYLTFCHHYLSSVFAEQYLNPFSFGKFREIRDSVERSVRISLPGANQWSCCYLGTDFALFVRVRKLFSLKVTNRSSVFLSFTNSSLST